MKEEIALKLQLAKQMLQSNQLKSAESLVNQLLRANPDNWQGRFLQGQILQRQGQYDLATEAIESSLELKPNEIAALMTLASIYRNRAMFDQAGNIYRQVLALDPDRHDVYQLLTLTTKYRDYNDEVRAMEAAYNATEVCSRQGF
jgi:Flp pilus assembly protein TadD